MIVASFEPNAVAWVHPIVSALSCLNKKIKALWHKIWSAFHKKHPSYLYAFAQQSNQDCHLHMWANFQRLQMFRTKDGFKIQKEDFARHRDWLGTSLSHYIHWFQAMKLPKTKKIFQDSVSEAPLYPHFYDAKGKNFFHSIDNPFEKGERRVFAPYFMKEASKSDISYSLPIYEENGRFFCYDSDTKKYEALPCNDISQLQNVNLSAGQRQALPPHFAKLQLSKTSGKRVFVQALDQEIAIQGKFVPRELGAYKLLLLNLGLDSNNIAMDAQNPDFEMVQEWQKAMNDTQSPWNTTICKKEHLIEYQLAELFKDHPELFEKVKKHVDFYFKTWIRYDKELKKLYDQNGCSLAKKNLERFLPGKEQMLAYCLMKNVQYLWINAISSTAFCHHMRLPAFARFIPFMVGPSRYKKAAYANQEGLSFIQLWKEVKTCLQKKFPDKQDWASFSGHGMVISFDPVLIQQQNQRKIDNLQLAKDLGIAGIDSVNGKDMDVFYRRSN